MTEPTEEQVDAAIAAIDNEWCPIDGTRLFNEETYDEHGPHLFALCTAPTVHVWCYDRGGEILDRSRVAEELAEHA